MKKLIPWIIWIVSTFVSHLYDASYWVVGPVFAAALLIANYEQLIKKFSWRHLALIICSTLIYALVFWIADKGWKLDRDWLDMLIGSTTAGVVVGSLLMPSVHAILFGIDFKTVRSVFLWLVASWCVVTIVSSINDALGSKVDFDFSLAAIALWQGIYLMRLKKLS